MTTETAWNNAGRLLGALLGGWWLKQVIRDRTNGTRTPNGRALFRWEDDGGPSREPGAQAPG